MFERGFDVEKLEAEILGEQFLRNNARACKQQRVGEFAEHQPDGKFRRRNQRGTINNFAERFGKFQIAHRIRRGRVDGVQQIFVFN